MPRYTLRANADYVHMQGKFCPACQSVKIGADKDDLNGPEFKSGRSRRRMAFESCGEIWYEHYQMISIELDASIARKAKR